MIKSTETRPLSPLLIGKGLPDYQSITPQQVQENIPILIKDLNDCYFQLEASTAELLKNKQLIEWEEIIKPLYRISERLRWSWGVVSHLNAVCNSKDFREAHTEQQPEIIRFSNLIGQSKSIYQALSQLKESSAKDLNRTQIRILESELLSMELRGVGLEGEDKQQFNKNSEKLAKISTSFSNNVLDSTNNWSFLLTKTNEIEGIPKRALEILAHAAKEAGDIHQETKAEPTAEHGPWRVGLDMPRYIPFMTYAKDRALREKIYKAYVSRASNGELNNQPLIKEILILREEQAKILGYKNWAEVSLANKMAKNIDEVEQLLEELREAALPTAMKELEELKDCAKRNGEDKEANNLEPWDITFWSERLRQEKFDINQEELRPWFPFPEVLKGLFRLCDRLFEIKIQSANGEAPIWNKDVSYFKIFNKEGEQIASFYLDPYSRPNNKRGGAWMDECLVRNQSESGEIVLPVAYLICNQTPPIDETPSLMSFDEVETLFHEFGHGLQHMLTKVDYPQAAGINNVEWDAVELPSQFMENWCLDKNTLMGMAKHWKTGRVLPEIEFEKLRKSRSFNSGFSTLRQIHFALTDLRLHSRWHKDLAISPDEFRREIAKETTVLFPVPEDQFLCAFSHIFAGGYAAGYYSYKWAEVLSADAYSAFEEAGLDQEEKIKEIGMKFKDTVLSLGGSRPPAEIFKAFRGRQAKTDALIRHTGLRLKESS